MRMGARAATLALIIAACTSSPAASPAASPSVTPTPTVAAASPTAAALPAGTFENKVLGYRITLPLPYRLSRSLIFRGQPELLGQDLYTTTTEAQDRAACLKDAGDIPSIPSSSTDGGLLIVWAFRNAAGLSAADWVRPRGEATHHTIEPVTVAGLEAVRLVQQGETQIYVIRAFDRMYELSPTVWPSQIPLGTIAATFFTFVPPPFPTPTPSPALSPRDAAAALATTLAAAFAARDADAVARLMSSCRIGVGAVVGGASTGGALNRSVALFVQALRDRFAANDLAVSVDPSVQPRTSRGGQFFVRSDWREIDRTIRIELELNERDGQWLWTGATHYYPSLGPGSCIPYRSPWISPTPGGPCS